MKIAVYLRVSSNEQNTENQMPALEAVAVRLGGEIVEVNEELMDDPAVVNQDVY